MKLTLLNFAYKNIQRDFKTYFFHFISCTFSVIVFFIFSTLTFHPALNVVEEGSSISIVLYLGLLVSLIFSFVFILYSVSHFLKQRSRQFAVLNIIGASNRQFKKIIFYENGIISLFSLTFGILFGLVFSKLFLMIAEYMISDLNLYFYFPIKAIIYTLLLMGGLFVIISMIAPFILRKKKIIALLKKEDEAEKNYILHVTLFLLILVPAIVYNWNNDDMITYPIQLLAFVFGSYVLFGIIFMLYALIMKKTQRMFRGIGLIKVSNFKYYIHTNLKTMTITIMLFTITLSSLIYIIGAPRNVETTTKKIMPYAYMYSTWDKNVDDARQANKIKSALKTQEGFKELRVDYLTFKNPHRDIVLSNSMYNKIALFLNRNLISLNNDDYFMVGTDGKNEPIMGQQLEKDFNELGVYHEKGKDTQSIALSGYFTSITVVADSKYREMTPRLKEDRFFAFDIKNWKINHDDLLKDIVKKRENEKETLTSAYWYYYNDKLQRNIIAYVGSILCISFLIGIASITYSRLYTTAQIEVEKYKTMIKLGMSKKMIKKSLSSTIRWIFVLPFLIALFLSWCIILYIDQFTIVSYLNTAIYCSILYLIIEIIIYVIIDKKYKNKIFKALYD